MAAIGVHPRVELAKAAGLAIGETGAIAVDGGMRASRSEAFAAGDCAEARHIVSGKPVWVPLGDIANRQGRVAGVNVANGASASPACSARRSSRSSTLLCRGRDSVPNRREPPASIPSWFARARAVGRAHPSTGPVEAMLVADRSTGRVTGVEAHGADLIDKYIDVVATAVWAGLCADDLADLDLAYAPPFSPVFAPAQVGAN